ncbi:carbamoyl-phosphate synthase large subunit [hot springs metagenome]|uniref:Carbamoyl phosphate synthase arginine-specific large chain, chloroplastic n=1 Tax=hot springs metagenome TaxID=433727 RepID=A0A5J4KZP9_9ZZZZ
MPKRTDIRKILLIGSGPIIIGQACEFDYSGTQACKALREEGYKIVLVNSNPATIMTDPEIADATYIEPLSSEILELIIKKERPDAILPTMGGQTALNLAVELSESGVLDRYSVELIGAKLPAIKKAEDRELFKEAMKKIGLDVPKSAAITNMGDGLDIIEHIGFPAILRPAFTLGGTGGGIAYNIEEYRELLEKGLKLSPVHQVLVEESALGWKEYELEVMRDRNDNVVIICSIENFDPMGVHTGDSITVAPAQTLTDKEYQRMRDAAIAVIREIGVNTGGSNIQFAINPKDGRMIVIEMNPRVSRSSALASKATGFPIAKIAAKLAVGYTLDEIRNDITKETPASFEPTIDYVVTKIPRFTFEKFPEADTTLTTQMKSVGEVMSIGRTFKESLQKALRSLEIGSSGFEDIETDINEIKSRLKTPNAERIWYVAQAMRQGMTVNEIYELTWIDPWFLNNIKQIVEMEEMLKSEGLRLKDKEVLSKAKEYGFSDKRIAELTGKTEADIRKLRIESGINPVYKLVDTCAAEFEAYTPYLYSTYEKPFYSVKVSKCQGVKDSDTVKVECESNPTDRKKVIILGSGPNRIGQGIEFDYCCVHAVFALKELGYETIMVNCNPETVSTDYDTADRLYFEPLTIEDVLNIVEKEKPEGIIVQFGGQTPLKLAVPLEGEGVKILGTSPDSIDRAEDRKRFKELLHKLDLKQPESGTAMSCEEAIAVADSIGYPVMVRPSYVLGGRAMEIVYNENSLTDYMKRAVKASPEHPILIDKYLEDAIEVDVDAISDGVDVIIGGVMEHIEEAGIHSGDSACSIPPYSLPPDVVAEIKRQTKALAKELNVIGLMNVQFAVKKAEGSRLKAESPKNPEIFLGKDAEDYEIYILEVNPRASRTIPYVSKATGVPLAKVAAKVMLGKTLKELGLSKEIEINHVAVKEAVFPFDRFPGVDVILGPEMKSTGEVMGIDKDFGLAYAKAQAASKNRIPTSGKIFISVKDKDKPQTFDIAKKLSEMGFQLIATRGTRQYLQDRGIDVELINKVMEGRPHVVDMIKNREVNFIINTVTGAQAQRDSLSIRRTALQHNIPYTTTISGAKAVLMAIEMLLKKELSIKSIQEYHKDSVKAEGLVNR